MPSPVPERLRLVLPPDPMATERLGEELGRHLHKGQVLALVGEIGAGKTTLVRGLARGLLVEEPSEVASPTYLLVVEHGGPRPLLHADAYLPQKLQGFLDDGGLEYLFRRDAVAVVEWADRIADLVPKEALWLELGPDAAGGRTCKFRCADAEDFPWLPGLGHNLRAR